MADNKAYLESIARSLVTTWGKTRVLESIRISQSPTLTTAGQGVKGLDGFLPMPKKLRPWAMQLPENAQTIPS